LVPTPAETAKYWRENLLRDEVLRFIAEDSMGPEFVRRLMEMWPRDARHVLSGIDPLSICRLHQLVTPCVWGLILCLLFIVLTPLCRMEQRALPACGCLAASFRADETAALSASTTGQLSTVPIPILSPQTSQSAASGGVADGGNGAVPSDVNTGDSTVEDKVLLALWPKDEVRRCFLVDAFFVCCLFLTYVWQTGLADFGGRCGKHAENQCEYSQAQPNSTVACVSPQPLGRQLPRPPHARADECVQNVTYYTGFSVVSGSHGQCSPSADRGGKESFFTLDAKLHFFSVGLQQR
jgi:hypothetical protein